MRSLSDKKVFDDVSHLVEAVRCFHKLLEVRKFLYSDSFEKQPTLNSVALVPRSELVCASKSIRNTIFQKKILSKAGVANRFAIIENSTFSNLQKLFEEQSTDMIKSGLLSTLMNGYFCKLHNVNVGQNFLSTRKKCIRFRP